mgnify:FL=1
MAHQTLKNSYERMVERLNRFPQGAPPSQRLFDILSILVDEREAALIAQLPIKPFTAAKAARIWKVDEMTARRDLDALASRAMLVDMERRGETWYVLPPPMAGFFEFSLMRTRGDIDQASLARLFHEYLNVEEDFVRELFTSGETQLGRAFVNEGVLPADEALHVLDHERASEVVRTASDRGVGMCYCRHKKEHLGTACNAPMDICMTFGATATSLIRHGHVRRVDEAECLDLLEQAREHGLVQFGENVRRRVSFVCNCCGCCCEAMLAAKRFAFLQPVHTTNWLPEVDRGACNGCGKCVNACPVEAVALVSANDAKRPKLRTAKVDSDLCLGCGVCVQACPTEGLKLRRRAARVLTPATTAHRTVVMALERGTLQDLLWDERTLWHHRALAAVFGALLKLPPVQRRLAAKALKSRYAERLLSRA